MKKKGEEKGKNNKALHHSTLPNKKSDETLLASEEKFELAFKHSPVGICISTLSDGRYVEINDVYSNFLGYSREELIGRTSSDINLWVDMAERDALAREIFQNGSVVGFELRFRDRNGKIHWGYTSATLVKIREESYLITQTQDITGKKMMKEEFEKSEAQYHLLADNLTDVIFTIDMNFNYTFASSSVYHLVGYTADELITLKVEQLVDPETLNLFADLFAQELEIEKQPDRDLKRSRVLEYQHVRKDGSKVWVENKITFLRDEKNTAIGIIGTVRDISQRKQAEEKLKHEEQIFRILAEQSSDVIIMADRKGIITYENPAIETTLGYKINERIGSSGFELIHPDDLKIATDAHRVLSQDVKARVQKVDLRFRHKDGSWKTCEVTASNMVNDNVIGAVIITLHDITERKRAEESLRQSEEKYRTILENIQEGYFETDFKGNFIFFNDITCQHFGYPREELMSLNTRQYTDEETSEKLFKIFRRIYKTGEPARNLNWQIMRKDGTKRDIEGSIFLQQDSFGRKTGFKGIAHDVTEQKKEKELLKQSEEKYRLLADHMKDQVWIMDLNLNVSYVSPSVEKSLGYPFEELKEMSLDKLLTPESFLAAIDFFSTEMPKALAASSDYILNRSLELQFRSRNGQTFWGESMFSFIRDENGKPVSLLGEGRNITERKKIESDLRISEENFHRTMDDSPLGVRISTAIGKTIYANTAILDIYGYENVEELENTPLRDRYTSESFAGFQARKDKRLKGEPGPSEYEISIIRKNGEIRHLYVFRKEIFWNGQKQSQVIYQDITLRRQAEEKLSATLENLRQSIKVTIQVLGMASEAKDPYMAGHQRRVADLARAIATEMKLPYEKIEAIRMAGAIHDIGKISVPSEILCKPAVLSDLEFSFIKNHPGYSYDIIKEVESPWPLADIVHQHHERINGSGYPLGLKNGDILVESRILAVADVVEAMISYRPYRPALELTIALAEIENNAGVLYDRNAVDACLRLFREKNFQMT